MAVTAIQTGFRPFKKFLPRWLSNPIRSVLTAILAPMLSGYRTGFFRSSFQMLAVSRSGKPLPWYTYPSIDFLKYRSYDDKCILEFGGGQSTLWWADRASRVTTFEGDYEWYKSLKKKIPQNVDLHYASMTDRDTNVREIETVLSSSPVAEYDVIVIDGLYREQMVDIACRRLAPNGIIICDNAEAYEFYERFRERGLDRVDFYGNAPGVVLPHCTCIFFNRSSFVFDPTIPIHVIAKDQ